MQDTKAPDASLSSQPKDRHYLEAELAQLLNQPGTLELLDQTILDGLWYWDLENPEHEYMSPTFWKTLGFDAAEKSHYISEWQDLILPGDAEIAQASAEKHLANPTYPFDQVVRYKRKNGTVVTIRCRGKAILRNGKPVRMLGAHTVVSDTKKTTIENRVSRMMDLSHDAIVSWTEETGIETWNKGAEDQFRIARAQAIGQNIFETTHAELPQSWEEMKSTLATGEDWAGEISHTLPDGTSLPTNTRITRMMLDDGRYLYLKISRDDTDRQRFIRQRELLLRELKHRVKNLFAVVQAMIGIASRSATDVGSLADDLRSRLVSLAAAHTVSLKDDPSEPIELREMVTEILSPYDDAGKRISISGETVLLGSNTITPMGLILHEFATNAVKHGSLRHAGGKVDINWAMLSTTHEHCEIRLEWRETPDPAAPNDKHEQSTNMSGFGSILMESSARQLNGTLERRLDGPIFCNILTFTIRTQNL